MRSRNQLKKPSSVFKEETGDVPVAVGRAGDVDDFEANPRFVYEDKSFFGRCFTSLAKTKLASPNKTDIGHSSMCRYSLLLLLVLVTVFLTPALLPRWLGFKWSTPSDLCRDREQKLSRLRYKMENISRIPEGRQFVKQAADALQCMNLTSAGFWTGTSRVRYPEECIPENAKAAKKEFESCVEPICTEACLRFLFIKRLACKRKCTKRKCTKVSLADPESEKAIASLTAKRQNLHLEEEAAAARSEAKEIKGTADKTAEAVISRLIWQVDFASNAYIVYTLLVIWLGRPLVVQKESVGNRLLDFLFGFRKSTFILIVVIGLSIHEVVIKLQIDTNFPQILKNFKNDPCYLDPQFSRARLQLIDHTCSNVTEQKAALQVTFSNMTRVFYDASLCDVSAVGTRGPDPNTPLIKNIDSERTLYAAGNATGYIHAASCNATQLNTDTATAPDAGVSFAEAVLGSGILAQILLKAVLSSWLVHLFAHSDPMLLHKGCVNVHGIRDGSQTRLSESERMALRRFARDKQLLPLIFFSILMVWEIVIIVYSMVQKYTNASNILADFAGEAAPLLSNFTAPCSVGKLQLNGTS